MISLLRNFWGSATLGQQCLNNLKYCWSDKSRIIEQIADLGQRSMLLVAVTGIFTGAIIAWQAAFQLKGIAPLSLVAGQIARVLVMEIGPVLTGLILAGRLGTAVTSELGGMVLSSQIDALRSLAIEPVRFLVFPRFIALVLMVPALTWLAVLFGMFGAAGLLSGAYDFYVEDYFETARLTLLPGDIWIIPIKGVFFGGGIAIISGYHGLITEGGVVGLRKATTRSFVNATLFILSSDLVIALLFSVH